MQTSVQFYKNIDTESVLFRRVKALKAKYPTSYWIGSAAGFGATDLTWHEAHTLAAQITVTILRTDSSSIFSEMRLMVQKDNPERTFKIKD